MREPSQRDLLEVFFYLNKKKIYIVWFIVHSSHTVDEPKKEKKQKKMKVCTVWCVDVSIFYVSRSFDIKRRIFVSIRFHYNTF